ncbi:hypothetical protein FOZ63_034063, partial [Perkinsus olseni]
LRLWTVMQYFGIEQLRACVSHDIECAARLRGMLQADEVTNGLLRFPIANPFGLVCFTAIPDSLNAKILREVESGGFMMYLTVAFGSALTTFEDVDVLFSCIKRALCTS